MQNTSDLYKQLLADPNHWAEIKLTIAGVEYLSTPPSKLCTLRTTGGLFPGDAMMIGGTVSAQIDASILIPDIKPPRAAELRPWVRLTEGERVSEWVPKGVYYIDTRSQEADGSGIEALYMHGYDAMMRAEADFPAVSHDWPATDRQVVQDIASAMGVELDDRTLPIINKGFQISLPGTCSMREVLSYIGVMYAGCWVMSDEGRLRLVQIAAIPPDESLLTDELGNVITIGGVAIEV